VSENLPNFPPKEKRKKKKQKKSFSKAKRHTGKKGKMI